MPISNRCSGMNFYNHLAHRKDIEVNLTFEQVKNISNKSFFLNHVDNIVNIDSFKHGQPEWLDSFADKNKINKTECYNNFWTYYLDNHLWVCSMELTYLNKKYNYYSISPRQKDSLNTLMINRKDSIKNLIKI
jgi:hypothetical protein